MEFADGRMRVKQYCSTGGEEDFKTTGQQDCKTAKLQECKNARLQNYMGAHMTLPWLLRNLLYMGRMRAKEYCSLEYERNRRVS